MTFRQITYSIIYKMEVISLMHEIFDDSIAAKVIAFFEHATARMLKDHLEHKAPLTFDPGLTGANGRPYTGLHTLEAIGGILHHLRRRT